LSRFVSAIHIPPFSPSSLISGGGDPMLKIWDWMSGKVLHEIVIFDTVKPFIKVKAPTRKQGGDDREDEEASQRRNKGKHKQEKREAKVKNMTGLPTPMVEDIEMVPPSIIPGPEPTEMDARIEGESEIFSGSQTDAAVLVVNKIETVASKQIRYILFSAIGSVLFCIPYLTR
jgi:tRNA (guanine-N(7)-)-methyltransferase subunit TRM82